MSKYYYLITGLPNLTFDDTKVAYTVGDFKTEISEYLSKTDKKLIDLFYLKYDNKYLLAYLNTPDVDPDPRGTITYDDLNPIFHALKEGETVPKNKAVPSYFITFLSQYLKETNKDNDYDLDSDEVKSPLSWEDRLSALYFEYAMKCKNAFITQWFELNLNINNILTAITCRKYNLDKKLYIIGDNEVAENIRTSNARDFGLGDEIDYLLDLQRIAEESDLMAREKKIDLLKWKWLEDNTFFKVFDIECLFTYILKLEMIERWTSLDKTTGEKTFREIVGGMKSGSENALNEFKRNNNK
jgi:hypothetical protein